MSALIKFIKKIIAYRSVIGLMSLRSIQSRYVGTLGGMIWSIVNPLMMILVYWFVFSVGFKVRPANNLPFIVVFLCGLIPWSLFNEVLTTNVNAVSGNAQLVKKTVFPTEILPVVNLCAGFISHVIMLAILLIVLAWNQISLSVFNFQVFYYLLALSIFCLGMSWFFSAINVFYRDIGQILGIGLNLWFWLTPIVWGADMLPPRYLWLMKLNPMYYIIEGYRDSFIGRVAFWDKVPLSLYFWILCLSMFAVGGLVFRRLKPEFADVV